MFESLIAWIVECVAQLGYPGIIVMMMLESSFFPFPSEVVMIPAGYLSSRGEMSLIAVILCGIIGSLVGAVANYYIARSLGRKFLLKYGKYMLIHERTILRMEQFFEKHGAFSTFGGRLLPGIRQYISLPAGVAKMNLKLFIFFTALGAGIWVVVLALIGYYIGENEALVKSVVKEATLIAMAALGVLFILYMAFHKRRGSQ